MRSQGHQKGFIGIVQPGWTSTLHDQYTDHFTQSNQWYPAETGELLFMNIRHKIVIGMGRCITDIHRMTTIRNQTNQPFIGGYFDRLTGHQTVAVEEYHFAQLIFSIQATHINMNHIADGVDDFTHLCRRLFHHRDFLHDTG